MIFKDKKQIIIAFIIVIFFIFLSVFVAFFVKDNTDKNNLSVSIDSKSISITNELPISDILGKKINEKNKNTGYATISIKNNNKVNTSYQIIVTKKQSNKTQIKENYIKLYLCASSGEEIKGFDSSLIPSYNDLRYLTDKPTSKLLYKGTIAGEKEETLLLKVWVSDSYALSEEIEDFTFDIGVIEK